MHIKIFSKSGLLALLLTVALGSCASSDDEYVATSPVVMNLDAVPYPKLSDYKFFSGAMNQLQPSFGVLPYRPASELFTDYAQKSRFIWMPKDSIANYTTDHEVLNLPIGSALLKNFYYDQVQPENTRKIIETRVMIRKTSGWIFANYVWNNEQTEATLDLQGSTVPLSWRDQNNVLQTINYKIPSQIDCAKCHAGMHENQPIGIKPQNLNHNYSYSSGSQNQLSKWIAFGYLENNLPANIISTVNYLDASQDLNLRVRSYFDSNCAHCHREHGDGEFVSIRMAFNETVEPAKMGVCVGAALQVPGISHGMIVSPNNTAQSTLYYMMTTDNTNFRMPRVGRTMVHQEGVNLVQQWIASLPACN